MDPGHKYKGYISLARHLNCVAMTTRQRLIIKKEPMTISITK